LLLSHDVASTVGRKRLDWVSKLSQAFLHCLWRCSGNPGDGSPASGAVFVDVNFLALLTGVVESVVLDPAAMVFGRYGPSLQKVPLVGD
jgi:hypothetical protein